LPNMSKRGKIIGREPHNMSKTQVWGVILAGGKGTRLNCTDRPKVMIEICGKPIIRYVINALRGVTEKIIIVTGFMGEKITTAFQNEGVQFVHQAEQLGTAHALMQAERILKNKKGIVLIVNGDGPLFTKEVFSPLVKAMESGKYTLVFSSVVETQHPEYGRIVRNKENKVVDIVEAKDANAEQKAIKEKNVGVYAVDNSWLWRALKKIEKSSVSGEYYITDLVKIALAQKKSVEAIPSPSVQATLGVNTPEELKQIEQILCKK